MSRRFATDLKRLTEACPHMARAVEETGKPASRDRDPGFATLMRIIVDQQVSVQAGRAIWGRLEAELGEVTPENMRRKRVATLRRCGLSRGKTEYARGAAAAILKGELSLEGLEGADDETAREALTALKGIGPWTADIYLMFALGRPDVWPVGDVALQESARRLLGLEVRPSPAKLQELGEQWRPWRTTAAVMLWHYYKRRPVEG